MIILLILLVSAFLMRAQLLMVAAHALASLSGNIPARTQRAYYDETGYVQVARMPSAASAYRTTKIRTRAA